jgi:hypothetical protein
MKTPMTPVPAAGPAIRPDALSKAKSAYAVLNTPNEAKAVAVKVSPLR